MLKSILAIIVSYIAMFAILMAIFTCLYFCWDEARFSGQTVYEVSMLWIALRS